MDIRHETLDDVTRFLEHRKQIPLADMRTEYESYLRVVRRYANLTPETRILEIGTGSGWFPLLCAQDGLHCKGIEISAQLIEHARETGRQYGLVPDIEHGNVEDCDLPSNHFDVVIANSVFEHIERWPIALARVYSTLKPGGMFFFISTNRFSLISDEYAFPLYGWLPDRWRYRFRIARQGPDIMKLGIDFNQFTYPRLRRAFREVGFSRAYDHVDIMDPDRHRGPVRWAARILQSIPPLRWLYLTFSRATLFVCIK